MALWRSPPEKIQSYRVQRWARHMGLGVGGEGGYLFCVTPSQENTHLCARLPIWSQATAGSISHLPPQPGSDQTSPGAHSASLNHLPQSHLRCLRKQTPALASPPLVLPPINPPPDLSAQGILGGAVSGCLGQACVHCEHGSINVSP